MNQLNHTASAQETDDRDSASPSRSLANPRRTRLGADGRPITGPVSNSASD
jgi:hypothetical protein